MRNLRDIDRFRNRKMEREFYGQDGDAGNGVFFLPAFPGVINVIASNEGGWDHVSVSLSDRIPTYDEMCRVKALFFRDDETVMQLHVPQSDHINCHPNCLHLWRPQNVPIPRPPGWMVGKQGD